MPRQPNVEDWERLLSVAIGAGWLAHAARRRQLAGAVGALGLIARGAAGFCPVNAAIGRGRRRDDTRRALGGSHGIGVREVVTIECSADDVFAFWNHPDNLPRFMRNVERVQLLDDGRSHWVVRGPAGVTLEWDAEIINEIDGELIAWRSLPGADVASAGSVRFRPRGHHRTEVTVTLQYRAARRQDRRDARVAQRPVTRLAAPGGSPPPQAVDGNRRGADRQRSAGR